MLGPDASIKSFCRTSNKQTTKAPWRVVYGGHVETEIVVISQASEQFYPILISFAVDVCDITT